MNPARRRAGFTLTEILMATGILGIGLTMVASVFPVALDQSRRSQEQTMAALSARSVAAMLRARRDKAMAYLRATNPSGRDKTVEMTSGSSKVDSDAAPFDLRNYNPNIFLYYSDPKRSYTRGAYNYWTTGGYIPVVFATPIATQVTSTAPGVSYGPWRITIVIYKSTGMPPFGLDPDNTATYLKSWKDASGTALTLRTGPGSYLLQSTATDNFRGEGYMIESVIPSTSSPPKPSEDKIALTTGPYPAGGKIISMATPTEWWSLPGAMAVYHTILGD